MEKSIVRRIGSKNYIKTKAKNALRKADLRGSRFRRNIRRRSKYIREIPKGIIHVQSTENNTTVTVTDVRGQAVWWSSGGTSGFQGPRRGTPFAAQHTTLDAINPVIKRGLEEAEVLIKGNGPGRDPALRIIRISGIVLSCIRDITPTSHNGCRPPKKRIT